MQRNTVLAVVFALFALLALGVAAATLTDTTTVGSPGSGVGGHGAGAGTGDADQGGQGAGSDGASTQEVMQGIPAPPFCAEWLETPGAVGAMLAVVGLVGALAYYDTRSILPAIALFVALGVPMFMLWFVLTACGSWAMGLRQADATRNVTSGFVSPGGSAGSSGASEAASAASPTLALALLVVVAIAVAVVLLFVSTGDAVDEADDGPDEQEMPAPDVAAVGRAAGRAADRIEREADVGNEVFRAWAEMTTHLDVDRPESSTPAEFAEAAVDAGMDRADVAELTTLFEKVRYGGETATEERESRAVAALRRIEAGYATDEDRDGEATARGERR